MFVLQSLWERSRPGRDGIAHRICYGQWTPIHLSTHQFHSGVIPLRHVARLLGVDDPPGLTWIVSQGSRHRAERIEDCLVVPPGVLASRVIALKRFGEGYTITHQRPNLMATTQWVRALQDAGWDMHEDPFDDDGFAVIPPLLRASALDPTLRRLPTLPLEMVKSLSDHQIEARYR
ncbi:hypothetical protein [Stomatohabitans albus]|uniref:hypothetical protein n=1 Tax=Stomatohabitans albus TaxID=3110766 RepID=UPI00300CDCAC